jgi:hypothetical protein
MTDLREYARGQECMIRSPVCNHDPETTVLAHYRMVGISGMGLKSPDLLGSWACSRCHAYCDEKTTAGRPERDRLLLHGVIRTQYALIKADVVTW